MQSSTLKLLSLLLFSFAGIGAQASELKLSQGTISLGGKMAFPMSYDSTGAYIVRLRGEPEFSYFVFESLKLVSSLEISGDLKSFRPGRVTAALVTWGLKAGGEYLFDTGTRFYPFAGLKTGFRVKDLYWERAQILAELPLGVLWAMNENLAISFSMPVELALRPDFSFDKISLSPGYFGVVGFF